MQKDNSSLLLIAIVALAASSGLARADSRTDLEKQINQEYRGKVLTLKQFSGGSILHFGPEGNLIGKTIKACWTTDAQVEVKEVKLKDSIIQLKARRLRLVFDPSSRQFKDAATVSPGDEVAKHFLNPRNKKAWHEFIKSASVEVDLDLVSPPQEAAEIATAIDRIFVSSNDAIVNSVPAFWKDSLLGIFVNSPNKAPAVDGSVYKVGGNVTPPRPLSAPEPGYSELARQAGYSGNLALWMVVTPEGHVRDLSVVTPLGLGLDESAVETVSHWTFQPALKDGVPVAVQISVQVDFHLF